MYEGEDGIDAAHKVVENREEGRLGSEMSDGQRTNWQVRIHCCIVALARLAINDCSLLSCLCDVPVQNKGSRQYADYRVKDLDKLQVAKGARWVGMPTDSEGLEACGLSRRCTVPLHPGIFGMLKRRRPGRHTMVREAKRVSHIVHQRPPVHEGIRVKAKQGKGRAG